MQAATAADLLHLSLKLVDNQPRRLEYVLQVLTARLRKPSTEIAVLLPLADLHPQAADDRYELRYRVYAYELTRRTHYGNALYEAFRSRPAIRPDPAVTRRRQGRTLSEEPTP